VMGKMIDAQSIVVASTATHQQGQEAAIFKAVFVHSIALACIVGMQQLGTAINNKYTSLSTSLAS